MTLLGTNDEMNVTPISSRLLTDSGSIPMLEKQPRSEPSQISLVNGSELDSSRLLDVYDAPSPAALRPEAPALSPNAVSAMAGQQAAGGPIPLGEALLRLLGLS